MPTKNSGIISIRVSNEAKNRFESMLKISGMTKTDFVNEMCDRYEEYYGEEPEYRDRVHRDLDRFIEILTEKGYPDAAIGVYTEQIVRKAKDMERYKRR